MGSLKIRRNLKLDFVGFTLTIIRILMMETITFQAAIQKAKVQKQKLILLLGNGFSIDFDPKFSQKKIIQSTQDQYPLEDKEIYTDNENFEAGVQQISELKNLPPEKKQESLKKFIEELSHIHPKDPDCITPIQFNQCAKFLSNFQSIYTLNYDLLLYWVIMRKKLTDKFKDGFCKNRVPITGDFLTWYPYKEGKTNLRYLHGSLHLYLEPKNNRIAKHRYSNGKSLKEQFVEAIDKNEFPKVVSGGTSQEKLGVINKCNYLSCALESLKSADGFLFIHGFNFNPNDEHIIDAIAHSQIEKLFISIHPSNKLKNIHNSIKNIQKIRNVEVTYYHAKTAEIWRSFKHGIEDEQCATADTAVAYSLE